MPVIGSFHNRFWKARANAPPAAGASMAWMYPQVQSVVIMSMAIWGAPLDTIRPVLKQMRWLWTIARRLWQWRHPVQQDLLEAWIDRLDRFTPEEAAVLERVARVMEGPYWTPARAAVRRCANTPKFHQPEQWIEYGRALKANRGQAQNVFRHVKAVSELRGLADGPAPLSNPDAHLVIELAYQGFAALGRVDRIH